MYSLAELAITGLITFIVGILISAITFIINFSSKLSTLTTEVKNLKEAVDDHLEADTKYCPIHDHILGVIQEVDKTSTVNSKRIENLEKKVDK